MAKNDKRADPVADLETALGALIRDVGAVSTAVAILERSTRDHECVATLSRLSVICGEFVDRLHQSRLEPLRKISAA